MIGSVKIDNGFSVGLALLVEHALINYFYLPFLGTPYPKLMDLLGHVLLLEKNLLHQYFEY